MSRSNLADVVLVSDSAVVWRASTVAALVNENDQKTAAKVIGVAESSLSRFLKHIGYTRRTSLVPPERTE